MNTIMKYLLEETSRYENSYSHYLYTSASDMAVFSDNASSSQHFSKELSDLKVMVRSLNTKLCQMEQTNSAFRLFFTEQLKGFSEGLAGEFRGFLNECTKKIGIECERSASSKDAQTPTTCQIRIATDIHPESEGQTESRSHAQCTHIPRVSNWREVVEHWVNGDPSKNLVVPLRNWSSQARTTKFKSIFHDRRLIGEEFEKLGKKDFLEKYKPDEISIAELKKAIRRKRSP